MAMLEINLLTRQRTGLRYGCLLSKNRVAMLAQRPHGYLSLRRRFISEFWYGASKGLVGFADAWIG